jgi:hypothetical protein
MATRSYLRGGAPAPANVLPLQQLPAESTSATSGAGARETRDEAESCHFVALAVNVVW